MELPDISEILLRGGTEPNEQIRRQAEAMINEMLASNLPLALLTLTNEISSEQKNEHSRRIAGSVFKNALSARNPAERRAKEQAWLSIDANLRNEMKSRLFVTLASPNLNAAESAANVISRIAQIELPHQQWNDLAKGLLENVGNPNSPPHHKIASLKTLGYICEDIQPEALRDNSDAILTAVIQGIRRETQNVDIIVAAGDAFYNCLKFIERNFDVPNERDIIMKVLIDSASIPHPQIQTTLLMCLVEIAHLYYKYLAPFMEPLFSLTLAGIREGSASPEVASLSIEFWSTICSEEEDLSDDVDNLKLINKALEYLVPPLIECLAKRDEDDDDDDSLNIAIAASNCLESICNVVGDQILPLVTPFIRENIRKPDWKSRDAATLLFANILGGTEKASLEPYIEDLLPLFFEFLKSDSTHLKNTSCWTIGNICRYFPEVPIKYLDIFLQTLGPILNNDAPDISNHCCFAIHNIAQAFSDKAEDPTSGLTQYYKDLITALVGVAYRKDGAEIGLRSSAFIAISAVIENGAKDTIPVDLEAITFFLERLEETLGFNVERIEDRESQIELHDHICVVLSEITKKVGKAIWPFHAKMLQLLLATLEYHAKYNSASSIVQDDVLVLLGTIASVIEEEFAKYLPPFWPFINQAFKRTQEASLIRHCIGFITDISGALKKHLTPFCGGIMETLLFCLKDDLLDANVKPLIITCFGDIANAIGGDFAMYLGEVSVVLAAAANTRRNEQNCDEEYEEFLGNLRLSILDAYTGIIQGLKQDRKEGLFLEAMGKSFNLFEFIDVLASEIKNKTDIESKREDLLKGMVGVIGDFAEIGGPEVAMRLNRQSVQYLLNLAKESEDDFVQQTAQWALEKVSFLFSNR